MGGEVEAKIREKGKDVGLCWISVLFCYEERMLANSDVREKDIEKRERDFFKKMAFLNLLA